MLVMIDNYDSFTWNLIDIFKQIGLIVKTYHNDQVTIQEIEIDNPEFIVISPGPCTPKESKMSMEIIQNFAGKIPILGVCLGHQCLAKYYGSTIVRADKVMHGKTVLMHHDASGIFAGLPNPFLATQYNSLIIEKETLPSCLAVTSWTQTDQGTVHEIMGIRHHKFSLEGVQFHPESIMTQSGVQILKNFIDKSKKNN